MATGVIVASCSANDTGGGGNGPCGNGKLEPGEECDGAQLGSSTCTSLGYTAGTLTCNKSCKLEKTSCCADECTTGEKICQDDVVSNCGDGTQGCKTWVAEQDCATESKICASTAGQVLCKDPNCVDECFQASQTQCNGDVVETCTTQSNGCNTWVPGTDCGDTNEACAVNAGAAACEEVCTDQCSAGETQCSGNDIQECEQVGKCLGWSTTTDCASNGEVCKVESGSAVCGPACTTNKCPVEGGQTCIDNKVNTCTKQADACLDWAITDDCGAQGLFCKFGAGGVSACQGTCADPCTSAGQKKCNANTVQECTQLTSCVSPQWTIDTTCPLGQACDPTSFTCVPGASTGEDCGTVIPIVKGLNTVDWTATTNNYLTSTPACSSGYAPLGPDVVMAYVAPFTGTLDVTVNKPASTRWTMVVAGGNCGSLSQQVACYSDSVNTSMGGNFAVTQGNTYFFYIVDTANGALPLSDPFTINLAEIDCSTFSASGVNFTPAKGGTSNSLSPKLTVDFDTALKNNVGSISVTGNMGTNFNFTVPSAAVVFSNLNKTITMTPPSAFKAGEQVTVSWVGLQDNICSKPLTPAGWSFTIITPPCSPGQNGMLGASVTKQLTALNAITPYYMVPDTSPTGWVYIGATSDLYRASKVGSSLEYVNTLATINSTHLGYAAAINANDIFTLDSKTAGTGWVWRISTTGGASWSVQDFVTVPTPSGPTDSWDSVAIYKDKMYFATSEASTGTPTQIWSVDATPTNVPTPAVLESTIPNELNCVGLGVDDANFYLTCGNSTPALDRVIRVNRTSGAITLLSNQFDLNTITNPMVATDTNNDGSADYLYFKSNRSEVYFVCNPAGANPYTDLLVSYGTNTASYPLGYDPVAKRLYAWDNLTKQIVVIQ
jgi:hypothetical protein